MFLALLAVASVTSCGSSSKMTARVSHSSGKGRPSRKPLTDIVIDPGLPSDTRTLLAEARTWLGVPYMWGGNDRNGVDCSGFVTQVFQNALQIKLPRTSASQCDYCTTVDSRKLQPGDLVFFDTTGAREGRVSHVGLYIGDGNMIHASSTKGVTVSAIDGVYFGDRLLKAGRVTRLMNVAVASGKESDADRGTASVTPARPTRRISGTSGTSPAPAPSPAPVSASVAAGMMASPDDARSLVLDMLVEQKLDSIYSR